ncbi:hypothetical protein ACEWPM_004045 [Roseovarius sp. S4756]|uniref:hypothetical protein n=1 Tax=Roseovarius maritimus TaxID=3342637 RepID=UPI003B683B67
MNIKLHAVSDSQSQPVSLFITAAEASDYIGARPGSAVNQGSTGSLADRGYDGD